MTKRRPDPADRLRAALAARAAAEEADADPWPGSGIDDDGADLVDDSEAGAAGRHAAPDRRRRPRDRDDPPPLVSWPVGLRDRFGAVPHPVVLAFLVLAVLAGGIFGIRVVNARAEATPVPVAAPSAAQQTTTATPVVPGGGAPEGGALGGDATVGSATGPAGSPAAGAGPRVIVHIVGQIAHPGVVSLPAGSRVQDAIEKAGGPTSKADLAAVNLARLCVDGEQIRIPKPGEAPAAPSAAGPGGGSSGPPGAPGAAGGKISLNTADAAALDTLPGVGPVLAQRILDWRTQHGRFSSIDELGEVSGIGEKLLAQLTPLVTL